MKPHSTKRLLDIQSACLEIERYTSNISLDAFLENRLLDLAVHKLLENVGEALNQLSKEDLETAAQIAELRRYVSLRNQISHGYGTVNYSIVWDVAVNRIPALHAVVNELLAEEGSSVESVGTEL